MPTEPPRLPPERPDEAPCPPRDPPESPRGAARWPPSLRAGGGAAWEAAAADARARATRWVLDTLGGTAAGLRWTLETAEGAPGPVLVARSRGARLLVLGTREHIGLRRAVVGSVSHYCLSHAVPPVVAVPADIVPTATAGSGHGGMTAPPPLL